MSQILPCSTVSYPYYPSNFEVNFTEAMQALPQNTDVNNPNTLINEPPTRTPILDFMRINLP